MQVYSREQLAASLPYHALIEALDEAFRSGAEVPQRLHYDIEVPGAADAALLLMPAWRRGGYVGVKIATVFPGNAAKGLPAVTASYLLLDGGTGEALALLDGSELTLRRTAAASALASRYLSRRDARSLLMVGTGKLAPHLVLAHAVARKLDRVMIWGRRADMAAALADELSATGIPATSVTDLEPAVQNADIVSCATLATEPLIKGAWLRPGQHLDLVGAFRPEMREADSAAVSRCEVYVDTVAGALAEAGEIVQALECGAIERSDIRGDLFALARAGCPARQTDEAITLFKSVGTAIEDLAAAELAISRRSP